MSSGATGERDSSLDVVRGVAMILVVMGHSIRGIATAKLGSRVTLGNLDTFLYLFRLPMFAIAVGLLTPGAILRRGARGYLRSRWSLLLYLFVVWTFLQGTAEVVTSSIKNRPTEWLQVLTFWRPLAHLWYLPHLMIVALMMVVITPWRGGRRTALGVAVAVVLTVVGWGWDPGVVGLSGLGLLVWYVLGSVIGVGRYRELTARVPTWLLVPVGLLCLGSVGWTVIHLTVTPPTAHAPDRTIESVGLGVVGAIVAVAGAFALLVAWSRSRTSRAAAYVGRHSLVVFLPHILVTAATRIVLLRLGVQDPIVHLVLGTTLGVGVPLLVARLTAWFPYLFVEPWRVHHRPVLTAVRP